MKSFLFSLTLLLGFSFAVSAQTVSKESIDALNKSKEILKLKTEINKNQLKLADETNNLNKLKELNPKLQEEAQKAADKSKEKSGSLSVGDEKAAKEAKSAVKDADKANNKVIKNGKAQEKSQKKIFDYNYKIQELNSKLKVLDPSEVDSTKSVDTTNK